MGDIHPQVSPDGRLLAFVRSGARTWGNQDVWVQPVSGGEARRLTFGKYGYAAAPSWTADGAEIVFTNYASVGRLVRVPLAGGVPQPVAGVGESAVDASVRGNLMVYVQDTNWVWDTWRLPRPGVSRSTKAPPQKLPEIWKIPSDGGTQVQVTRNGGMYAVESEDGRDLYY